MKKLIIAILAIIYLGANAQNKEEKGKFREEMKQALNMTPEQMKQMQVIHHASKKVHEENKVKFASDKKALHQANQTLKNETEVKIQKVLSPEQYSKFTQLKEDKRKERVLKRTNEMSDKLGLSAEQHSKFLGFVATRDNKMKANRTALSNDPEKLRESNKIVKKEFREQLKSILSKEQMEKLKLMKQEKNHK